MPNTKAALRHVRKTKIQTQVNRVRKSKYKAVIRQMEKLISTKKKKDAMDFLPKLNSQLMKIVKTGVIKKKTASRKISKLTKKIYKL